MIDYNKIFNMMETFSNLDIMNEHNGVWIGDLLMLYWNKVKTESKYN